MLSISRISRSICLTSRSSVSMVCWAALICWAIASGQSFFASFGSISYAVWQNLLDQQYRTLRVSDTYLRHGADDADLHLCCLGKLEYLIDRIVSSGPADLTHNEYLVAFPEVILCNAPSCAIHISEACRKSQLEVVLLPAVLKVTYQGGLSTRDPFREYGHSKIL